MAPAYPPTKAADWCWHAFRETRAARRAVDWLADNSLIDGAAAMDYLAGHPDPELP